MPGQILVVDDDPIECKSLTEFLKLEGYSVDSAESGGEAIEKLNDRDFEVVLTDVNMPDVTGFDILKHSAENHPDVSPATARSRPPSRRSRWERSTT